MEARERRAPKPATLQHLGRLGGGAPCSCLDCERPFLRAAVKSCARPCCEVLRGQATRYISMADAQARLRADSEQLLRAQASSSAAAHWPPRPPSRCWRRWRRRPRPSRTRARRPPARYLRGRRRARRARHAAPGHRRLLRRPLGHLRHRLGPQVHRQDRLQHVRTRWWHAIGVRWRARPRGLELRGCGPP